MPLLALEPNTIVVFGSVCATTLRDLKEGKAMLLVLILILLLLGGGGGYYGYSRWGAGGGVSIFGLVLFILLVYYLVGGVPVRP